MNLVQKLLISILRFYRRAISPLTPPSCRFQPTCSQYGIEAIQEHGPVYGSWLTTKRVCRCHPWGGQGHDPVPKKAPSKVSNKELRAHDAPPDET